MTFLRTASTRRLLVILACLAALAGGGTAAVALSGSDGPVPPPKPLAEAIHDAITAPEAKGITARVRFTNRLIDTSGLEGVHPLLSGADGRLWLSPGRGFRLELQSENGDAQVVANRRGFWVYDGTDNTVYRGRLPKHGRAHRRHHRRHHKTPSVARIQRGLDRAERHKLDVSGPEPVNVGGEPGYEIRVEPGEPGGLLGGVEFAWDVAHGLPLRVGVYARGNDDPVLELEATEVEYGPVARSNFALDPPADAEVVSVGPGRDRDGRGHRGRRGHHRKGKTPFPVSAPAELAGLERTELRRRHGKAFITYGEGPGAILVVESKAKRARAGDRSPADKLELPSVTINGATGKVLDTPLGSVVTFERDGVRYTVLGSVRAEVAKAAARGL